MAAATSSTKSASTKTEEISSVVRDQVVGAVKQGQQLAIDAVTTWVDAFGKVVPSMPALSIPGLSMLPSTPPMAETVAAAFDVAEELLSAQRRFASELVSVLTPAAV